MADGTLRISFDIEPIHALDAFALFRAPGTPAAIAALQVGYAVVKDSLTNQKAIEVIDKADNNDKPKGGALAKLAGMWCADRNFYEFIAPLYDKLMGGNGLGTGDVSPHVDFDGDVSKYCAHCIKVYCDIKSRAELDHDPAAAEKFHAHIRGPYTKYLIAKGFRREII